jgi:large subunit ribosomal protein L10
MPNAKVLSEKQAVVAAVTEQMKNAAAGVLVNYSGITVAEDTELRRKLREANVEYAVIKNTMLRFAAENSGYSGLDSMLNGTTSIAMCKDDPVAPARIVSEFADKINGHFELKGGFVDGRVISVDEVKTLAKIPPLPILRAQVLGTMLAPISALACVIKAIAEKNGAGESAEAAPEAAPAQ